MLKNCKPQQTDHNEKGQYTMNSPKGLIKTPAAFTDKNDSHADEVQRVIQIVCTVLGISPEQLFSKSRLRQVVDARFITMKLLYERYGFSGIEIAYLLARDRTTVFHGIRTCNNLLHYSAIFSMKVKLIEEKLEGLCA